MRRAAGRHRRRRDARGGRAARPACWSPPRDPEALAAAIIELLRDPQRRARMARGVTRAPRGALHRRAHGRRDRRGLRRRVGLAGSGSSASSAAGTPSCASHAARSDGGSVSAAASSPARSPGGRAVRVVGVGVDAVHEPVAQAARARTSAAASPKPPGSARRRDRAVARPRSTSARSRCGSVAGTPARARGGRAGRGSRAPSSDSTQRSNTGPTDRRQAASRAAACDESPSVSRRSISSGSSQRHLVRHLGARPAARRATAARSASATARRSSPAWSGSARDTCGVATTVARARRRAAARSSASASSRVAGPSSIPGSAWQWRSISTRRGRRSRPGA